MLLWLRNGLFFFKNVAVTNVLEGVPLQFVSHRPPRSHSAYKTNVFLRFLTPPGAESTGVGEANELVSGPT